jgi:hypothetical protein
MIDGRASARIRRSQPNDQIRTFGKLDERFNTG